MLRTMRTCPAHQPLRLDPAHRRSDQKGFHAHVDQPREAGQRVVGVDRRQHQMTRHGRTNGDFGSLEIADLADHDHVWVLTQYGAQGAGEGIADLRMCLNLGDVGHLVFDRVFHRDELLDAVVDLRERRGECGGFARPRGPRDQHDAAAGLEPAPEQGEMICLHTQIRQGEFRPLLRQHSQHHGFAEGARHRRHPDIHLLARDSGRNPSVLGQPPFRNVEARYELDAGCDCRKPFDRLRLLGVQNAVNAHTNQKMLLRRFNVDVGGLHIDCLRKKIVHELDYRRLFRHFRQLFGIVAGIGVLAVPFLLHEFEQVVDLVTGSETKPDWFIRIKVAERGQHSMIHYIPSDAKELVVPTPYQHAVIEKPFPLYR